MGRPQRAGRGELVSRSCLLALVLMAASTALMVGIVWSIADLVLRVMRELPA